MISWPWMKIAISLFVIVWLMIGLNWTANFVYRANYSADLAVEIEGFDAPLINRASLQRSWPEGLGDLSSRAQLRAHMEKVESLEVPPSLASAAATRQPAPEPDFATLLASADPANGERRARVCAACHTFDEGGRDGQGPNLWGVLGRDIASSGSFAYSDALSAEPGEWTFEKLNSYLESPSRAIPGNKMAFQGVRRARDRAEIIAFLRRQGAIHVPLPQAEAGDTDS